MLMDGPVLMARFFGDGYRVAKHFHRFAELLLGANVTLEAHIKCPHLAVSGEPAWWNSRLHDC